MTGIMKWIITLALCTTSCIAYGPKLSPKIYVYDNPLVDWSYLIPCYVEKHGVNPWEDESSEKGQNMGEVFMHQIMLNHPSRTMDPSEASIFYIPMYIVMSSDAEPLGGSLMCNGKTHMERVYDAMNYLETEAPHFKTLGGSDHTYTCTWWRCGAMLGNDARVILSRTILGINEYTKDSKPWSRLECENRVVVIPYVSSSKLSITSDETNREHSSRSIPFYFAGRARGRVERTNLGVISEKYPESFIGISDWDWTELPETYAGHITDSVFCLSPRGDTPSSRRLFDAVSAGCIPVITESQIVRGAVPFPDHLNYRGFSVVVANDTFLHEESVLDMAIELYNMNDTVLDFKRKNLQYARDFLVYGDPSGDMIESDELNSGVGSLFLKEVWRIMSNDNGVWECKETPWWTYPSIWLGASIPPPIVQREEWIFDSETIVSRENKILMCTPPFTGSRPIRTFFRHVQDQSNWDVKNAAGKDGLDVIKMEGPELFDIYSKVGWVKSSMVRDPVTRILSAFLLSDEIDGERGPEEFKKFIAGLEQDPESAHHSFMPMRSMCGMRYSHFESIIQYEHVNTNGKKFLRSLPGDIWKSSGENWGGDHVDVIEHFHINEQSVPRDIDIHTMFNTCGWTKFYDVHTIRKIGEIYKEDYDAFGFYTTEKWENSPCLGEIQV